MTRPDPTPRLTLKAWDRLLLIGSFGALVAMAWVYLLRMSRDGSMMTMGADWNGTPSGRFGVAGTPATH